MVVTVCVWALGCATVTCDKVIVCPCSGMCELSIALLTSKRCVVLIIPGLCVSVSWGLIVHAHRCMCVLVCLCMFGYIFIYGACLCLCACVDSVCACVHVYRHENR